MLNRNQEFKGNHNGDKLFISRINKFGVATVLSLNSPGHTLLNRFYIRVDPYFDEGLGWKGAIASIPKMKSGDDDDFLYAHGDEIPDALSNLRGSILERYSALVPLDPRTQNAEEVRLARFLDKHILSVAPTVQVL
jgi:hypothetical protein